MITETGKEEKQSDCNPTIQPTRHFTFHMPISS